MDKVGVLIDICRFHAEYFSLVLVFILQFVIFFPSSLQPFLGHLHHIPENAPKTFIRLIYHLSFYTSYKGSLYCKVLVK